MAVCIKSGGMSAAEGVSTGDREEGGRRVGYLGRHNERGFG